MQASGIFAPLHPFLLPSRAALSVPPFPASRRRLPARQWPNINPYSRFSLSLSLVLAFPAVLFARWSELCRASRKDSWIRRCYSSPATRPAVNVLQLQRGNARCQSAKAWGREERKRQDALSLSVSLSFFLFLSLTHSPPTQKRIREGVSRSSFSRENSRRLPPPGGSFVPGNVKLIERTRQRERSPPYRSWTGGTRKGARGEEDRAQEFGLRLTQPAAIAAGRVPAIGGDRLNSLAGAGELIVARTKNPLCSNIYARIFTRV